MILIEIENVLSEVLGFWESGEGVHDGTAQEIMALLEKVRELRSNYEPSQ